MSERNQKSPKYHRKKNDRKKFNMITTIDIKRCGISANEITPLPSHNWMKCKPL